MGAGGMAVAAPSPPLATHLLDVHQLRLVDLRDGDVVLGCDGEPALWGTREGSVGDRCPPSWTMLPTPSSQSGGSPPLSGTCETEAWGLKGRLQREGRACVLPFLGDRGQDRPPPILHREHGWVGQQQRQCG